MVIIMLTKEQAFMAAFKYLDKIYDLEPNETLGDLLSSMNPYLFTNSRSADPAIWTDWEMCINNITNSDDVTEVEAFQAMISFLNFNQQEFGYDLKNILKDITNKYNSQEWIEAIRSVK